MKVGMLVNACDCALLEGSDKTAGRRGTCGLVFIAKVCVNLSLRLRETRYWWIGVHSKDTLLKGILL